MMLNNGPDHETKLPQATKSSFQKRITFCRSIYLKKVTKLVAFIFEHPRNNGADQTTLNALNETQ